MLTTYALERKVQFIFEKRTAPYLHTVKGVLQKKIVHGAKSTKARRALLGLI
jgi:hypothetical protein